MTDVASPTGGYVLAVLPLGSTEQHGPHLPFETDTLLATAAAGVVADVPIGADHVRVLPALAYGASGEHQSFPGTVSMGTDALAETILELGRSITTWAGRLVVINGHGGNVESLRRAISRLRYEGRDCAWLSCRTAECSTDTHAGHAETSLMLHLYPERVRPDLAVTGCTEPLATILPAMRKGGVAAVSATGILGDPTTATEADGARLWETLAADVRDRAGRWNPGGTDGMLA